MNVERPGRSVPVRIPAASQSFRAGDPGLALPLLNAASALQDARPAKRVLFSSRVSACFWRTKPAAQTQPGAVTWTRTRLLLEQVRLRPRGAVEQDGVCPCPAISTRVQRPRGHSASGSGGSVWRG